jgi:hypothetical protein
VGITALTSRGGTLPGPPPEARGFFHGSDSRQRHDPARNPAALKFRRRRTNLARWIASR